LNFSSHSKLDFLAGRINNGCSQ